MNHQARTKPARRLIGGLILTCLLALGSMLWSWLFPSAEPEIIRTSTLTGVKPAGETIASERPVIDLIPIYLVGAVCRPGIYEVERGSYLYQLVEQAGGMTAEAATENINLALRLDSNQLIHIPTRAEADSNPGLVMDLNPVASSVQLIDLNQADQDQLDLLPGIGPSTALAIVEYRKKNGFFKCVEDLMQVPGIKESRFNVIKDLVVVRISS